MAIQTIQYFKDKFVTGYVMTQQDYTDWLDTIEDLGNGGVKTKVLKITDFNTEIHPTGIAPDETLIDITSKTYYKDVYQVTSRGYFESVYVDESVFNINMKNMLSDSLRGIIGEPTDLLISGNITLDLIDLDNNNTVLQSYSNVDYSQENIPRVDNIFTNVPLSGNYDIVINYNESSVLWDSKYNMKQNNFGYPSLDYYPINLPTSQYPNQEIRRNYNLVSEGYESTSSIDEVNFRLTSELINTSEVSLSNLVSSLDSSGPLYSLRDGFKDGIDNHTFIFLVSKN